MEAANVAQQANVAIFLPSLPAAEVEYSKAANGKVVADRIRGVQLRETVGDRSRGLPVGRLEIVQTEKSRDAVYVRVEWDDQLGRIDEIPDAEVRRGAADHPA